MRRGLDNIPCLVLKFIPILCDTLAIMDHKSLSYRYHATLNPNPKPSWTIDCFSYRYHATCGIRAEDFDKTETIAL